jgi:Protein of unknown function (DUF1822)
MDLHLQALKALFPERICLPVTRREDLSSITSENFYSNDAARRTAQLNQLCLEAFMNWAKEELDLSEKPTVWPSPSALPSFWELVTGTAISIGATRLVLIPSDALDTEELCVPQEWVDIPEWAADYYVGAQIDLEQGWLYLWGYTSRRTLKAKGKYDPIYRTYSLERDLVLSDLDILWVAHSLKLNEKSSIQPFAALKSTEVNRLCKQLSEPSPYSPRLDLSFDKWAALIAPESGRQQLYQARLDHQRTKAKVSKAGLSSVTDSSLNSLQVAVVNAGAWLQHRVDEVARELSWILLPPLSAEPVGFRSPSQELETILVPLQRKGVTVPKTAASAYKDLQVGSTQLRLYAVTWPVVSAEAIPEWFLLLILSGPSDDFLPLGTRFTISDETKVLLERELNSNSSDQYLYGGVSGNWNESFEVTITLADATVLTLPKFVFQPESSK